MRKNGGTAGNLPNCGSRQVLNINVIFFRISFNIFSLVLVCPWRSVFHFMNVCFYGLYQ